MFSRQNPPASPPPGTIEFELTDFSEARQALDELPPGVGQVDRLSPGYWEERRRKPLPTDRALTGRAIDWLMALPPQVRPRELCEQFPRIANALAEAWADPRTRDESLQRLLDDGREGRRGFPADVQREIERLRGQRRAA